MFQRSLAADPDLARAWAGLAAAYGDLAEMDGYPADLQAQREDAARKAIALDTRMR